MKQSLIYRGSIFIFCLLISPVSYSKNDDSSFNKKWTFESENFVREYLPGRNIPFPAEYDIKTEKWVKRYMTTGSRSLEKMLGKTHYYFPIFEDALAKYDLPTELKYLAMVESGLKPKVESPVGAGGLWQFMPLTAKSYDLRMNDWVDDRFNPYYSSDAAANMLHDLYQQFEDWQLVLAAYNCGPGRVRKAIRKAGMNDYTHIKAFLPRQTRDYLQKYTAIVFVSEYRDKLGLKPRKFDLQREQTSVIEVYDWISLEGVSEVSGVNIEEILRLNPSYKKGIIPKSESGNLLIIPSSVALFFELHLEKRGLKSITYIYGKPKRVEPEPTTEYWASAYVKPVASKSLLQFNLQGLLSWSNTWGKSIFNTLRFGNFLFSHF